MEYQHNPVMLKQLISSLFNKNLNILSKNEKKIFVDGTFGRGGHSKELLKFISPNSKLFVFDRDPQAILEAKKLSLIDNRVHVIHACFSSMREELYNFGVLKNIDGIILDLGVSSPQLDQANRGFSFMRNGPLDMRMDNSCGMTIAKWLSSATLEEIYKVISKFGEERHAFKIAKKIVAVRQLHPINTTNELVSCISDVIKNNKPGKHPATKTFQALRIFINKELEELSNTLPTAIDILKPGGILAIISFHSLEDRIVKKFYNKVSNIDPIYKKIPISDINIPSPVAKKLKKITPDKDEIKLNPRSRSAILRILQINS
ncbi:Ribosomal RNA small subunit methyltransferase H [Candidatus Kinetoplastibacterium sorsogonicusi]|uniref:Ribosomal RNA small subunit methyltransferase H n=1 Tax=Candidatus Kinetoplastidibacterium kentomonadis TaxID=1576550 RepID=A0A3S7JAG4_9PROT|nr:16S rRNA (cytosine(1402)-N(4))-methyltransferase RsmH [Candidatus Kinetoplastibacterium sorsogonicusi]AWD32663.1 Ribosomal RNA small subunit methyltransferase H [Candidatus Kinetoplastibacterium sorsogonicusi]